MFSCLRHEIDLNLAESYIDSTNWINMMIKDLNLAGSYIYSPDWINVMINVINRLQQLR